MSTYRASFFHLLWGSQAAYDLAFGFDGTPTLDDLVTLYNTLLDWHSGYIAPVQAQAINLVQIKLREVTGAEPEYFGSAGMPVPGGSTNDPMPNQVAAVVTLRSSENTRSGRGRIYLPGLTVAATGIGGLFIAEILTSLNDAMVNLHTVTTVAGTWTWGVYSKTEAELHEIVSWTPQAVPGGLNKRRIGRGS